MRGEGTAPPARPISSQWVTFHTRIRLFIPRRIHLTFLTMNPASSLSRRDFLVTAAAALVTARLATTTTAAAAAAPEPIIDIHQHTNYGGRRDAGPLWKQITAARSDTELIAHQRALGATKTILLPSGRPVFRESTHQGRSNGLESTCTSNEDCMKIAREYPNEFAFAANEVPDLEEAPTVIEKYLKLGACCIAEQKFGVECDSPEMQRLYKIAEAYNVPILMHWQAGSYNYGLERFHTMLKKYPKTNFIGHAQTWWANIDRNNSDQSVMYPKGPVTPGGLTDRYLSDYSNMFGDLSAGSGLNALTRDEDFARHFIARHQDKLVYGSDCSDHVGSGTACQGAQTIATIRRLSTNKAVERKLLHGNAKKMFRL
jgi:predicted TIM-barrel fold metal-dependent hydrolase